MLVRTLCCLICFSTAGVAASSVVNDIEGNGENVQEMRVEEDGKIVRNLVRKTPRTEESLSLPRTVQIGPHGSFIMDKALHFSTPGDLFQKTDPVPTRDGPDTVTQDKKIEEGNAPAAPNKTTEKNADAQGQPVKDKVLQPEASAVIPQAGNIKQHYGTEEDHEEYHEAVFENESEDGPIITGFDQAGCDGERLSGFVIPKDADMSVENCISIKSSENNDPAGRIKFSCDKSGAARVCIYKMADDTTCEHTEPFCLNIAADQTSQAVSGFCTQVMESPNEKETWVTLNGFDTDRKKKWPPCFIPAMGMLEMLTYIGGGIACGMIVNVVTWTCCGSMSRAKQPKWMHFNQQGYSGAMASTTGNGENNFDGGGKGTEGNGENNFDGGGKGTEGFGENNFGGGGKGTEGFGESNFDGGGKGKSYGGK